MVAFHFVAMLHDAQICSLVRLTQLIHTAHDNALPSPACLSNSEMYRSPERNLLSFETPVILRVELQLQPVFAW